MAEFWQVTPWQMSVMVEAYSKRLDSEQTSKIGAAWYTAAFGRAAKLPPLKEVLSPKKTPSKMIDEAAIMATFKKYQQLRDEKKNGHRS